MFSKMSKLQSLKVYISQRLSAAVDDILGHLEMTILEYEEETERRHRDFSAEVKHQGADVPPDAPKTEEPPPQQLDRSSSVANKNPDPEPPLIKKEQEETHITKVTFCHISVKNEEDEEEAQSSQLHHRQTEGNIVTPEEEGCGEPELNIEYLSPDYKEPTSEVRVEDFNVTMEPYSGAESSNHVNTGSTNRNTFQCSECGERFNSPRCLKLHIRCHMGERPFRCPLCRKCFMWKGRLQKHMRIHTGEKPFRCLVCGKMFSESGNLKVHMRLHTGEKPFVCSVCGKGYAQKGNLKMHIAAHKRETVFGSSLHQSSQLHHSQTKGNIKAARRPELAANVDAEGHLEPGTTLSLDHGTANCAGCNVCKKPFSCSECGKKFDFKGQLNAHMRSHTGEKPFKCPICLKCFSWSACLQKHMRIHTGEKPYRCKVCGKGFIDSGNLKAHIRIHTGENPFSCSICGKSYRRKGTLNKHLEIHREKK